MTALYLLAEEYRAAAEKLADLDLDEQTVADTLESLAGSVEVKATNVAMFARNLEALAEQIDDAERAMAARRKAIARRAANVRAYLMRCMQATGIKKIEAPAFRIALRDNPAAVDVFDAAQVPAEFMRQPEPPPPSPDKSAIKEAIKSGADVPGCRLVTSQRVEIK